jgi:hypothetical protein
MIRSLVCFTTLCIYGASSSAAALTMQECRAKYKAAMATGTIHYSWVDYQVKQCGLPPPPARKQKSSR